MINEGVGGAPPFDRIAIVGLGLIGGSVALAARRAWPRIGITGVDRPNVLDEARHGDVIDRACASVAELADVELIVLATPVRDIINQIGAIPSRLRDVVVTDVGSTKRAIMAAAAAARLTNFTGGHPMAGAGVGGFANARADLFDGRVWWVVKGSYLFSTDSAQMGTDLRRDTARSVPISPKSVEKRYDPFVHALGARPRGIDAITHDRVMAYVSHLPQLLASTLAGTAREAVGVDGLAGVGQGFLDMTRLAGSSTEVWRDILATNADFVAEAARAFTEHLPATKAMLADDTAVDRLFTRGRAAREETERGL